MKLSTRRGFSLVEAMVAAAVLSVAATALFGLFSRSLFNLGRIQDLHQYQLAGEDIMNRVLMLPTLRPGQRLEGRIERLGARWVVNITPWYPQNIDAPTPEAVMKIDVELLWPGRSGERNLKLETLRAVKLTDLNNFDFNRAVQTIFP